MRSDRVSRGMVLRVYPGGKPVPQSGTTKSKKAPAKSKAAPETQERAAARPASGPVAAGAAERTVHLVKAGETLWSIARAYQTTVDALKRANRFLASRPLQAGDQLTILPPR